MPIKIGINGAGRIGRAILRIILKRNDVEVVAINDINPDINNIAYLIKYDSTYGRLQQTVEVEDSHVLIGNEKKIRVHHEEKIDRPRWEESGVDLVIDSSGVKKNLTLARNLKKQGVTHCIVTNAPPEESVDKTIMTGVNEGEFDPQHDFLLAGSICDANAFVPVAHVLEKNYGIEHGFLTTLHPWLNYQNVLDGPSLSYAAPGEIHDHFALGRASSVSLIPKTTSAISASCKVLKHLDGKFLSMSYRVPTMVVSSADISVKLKERVTVDEIKKTFEVEERNQKWKIFYNNKEALVSADFSGLEYAAVIDHRWIMINSDNYLKMVLWYDNEWGYASRVVDLISHIGKLRDH